METGAIQAFYDGFAAKQASMGVNERHQLIRDLALANGLRKDMRVLEMGCGIGTLTGLLARELRHGKLVAVDLSPTSITHARKALARFTNLDLRVADIVNDTLDGPFDMIILPDVLEHIPLPLQPGLFAKLRDLLVPTGKVLIHSPDPYYSDWLRKHRPEAQQVVDEALHLPQLTADIHAAGLCLRKFQRHCIWASEPDYMALVLEHPPLSATYAPLPQIVPGLWNRLRDRVKRWSSH